MLRKPLFAALYMLLNVGANILETNFSSGLRYVNHPDECAGQHLLTSLHERFFSVLCTSRDTKRNSTRSDGVIKVRTPNIGTNWWEQMDRFLSTRRKQYTSDFQVTLLLVAVFDSPTRAARYIGCALSHVDYALQWGYDVRIYRDPEPLADPWILQYVKSACERQTFLERLAGPIPEDCDMNAFQHVLVSRTMWIAKTMHEILSVERNSSYITPRYIFYMDLDAYIVNPNYFPVHRIVSDALETCRPTKAAEGHAMIPTAPGNLPFVIFQNQGCTINSGMILFLVSRTVLDDIIPLWIKEIGAFSQRHHGVSKHNWNGDQGPLMNAVLRVQIDHRYNNACGSKRLHSNSARNECFKKKLKQQKGLVGPFCLLDADAPYNRHDCGLSFVHGDFLQHTPFASQKCFTSDIALQEFCKKSKRCIEEPRSRQ